ncbi:type III effector protein, partial [Streptomyces sp. NPDC005899]
MTAADHPVPRRTDAPGPSSFPAAAAALEAIDVAVRAAEHGGAEESGGATGPERALASLLLLRELREQLAGWETGLIETARHAGASWADLAEPLGVASRQAAERDTRAGTGSSSSRRLSRSVWGRRSPRSASSTTA